MVTRKFVTSEMDAIQAKVTNGLLKTEEEQMDLIKSIPTDNFDSGFNKIGIIIQLVASVYRGAVTENGVRLPEFLTSHNVSKSDHVTEVDVTIKSKLKAEDKFRMKRTVKVDEDIIESLSDLFDSVLYSAFYNKVAAENVEALNEVLTKITEDEGINKKVQFAVTNDTGRVVSITDDEVVIKASVDRALDIPKFGIMRTYGHDIDTEAEDDESGVDNYDKLVFTNAYKELVDVLRTIQITPEIIKRKIGLVEDLGNLHTKKHSNKIIRESYHKKAVNLTGKNPDEVGYFSEKVTIDGNEVDVFALLSKDGDTYEVVLSPYDTDTNTAVDFDVISALK